MCFGSAIDVGDSRYRHFTSFSPIAKFECEGSIRCSSTKHDSAPLERKTAAESRGRESIAPAYPRIPADTPLYGGRDAPMRWFIALSERLRQHGFKQLKTDVCMFHKFDSQGDLMGMLIAHVGDLLFCGTDRFRKEAISAIQTFRTGEIETLTQESPIIFTGLLIELTHNGRILLPQQQYVDEMQLMSIDTYIDSGGVTHPALLKSTFKQGIGYLIWLHQTRPDIGFAITQIATSVVEACESPTKAKALANLYNKIIKFAKNHQRKSTMLRILDVSQAE